MKKFISGIIIGALLMVGTQSFAANIGYIGKKVSSETVVKVNGEEAGKAVIVDNKSFIPVRDISEKIGAKISFEKDGSILLATENPIQKEIEQVNSDIKSTKSRISDLEQRISEYENQIKAIEETGHRALSQSISKDALSGTLEKQKEKLTELEVKLKELESKSENK
jgi:predicted RNase H-like nuclease (RuvC/YqgF family)